MKNHPDYNSPSEIKSFLEENGLSMQKKFGQNFLINEDARKKLIDALDVKENMTVWEVGPGLGSMTEELLKRGVKLTAFEIDHGFARFLPEFFEKYAETDSFSLIEGDVLKTWFKYAEKNGRADRFFGNLPYNVAATIIADTINKGIRFEKAVFTVQKEVGLRMTAKPGSDDYSSFSVLCQWAYDVKPLMDLAGGNFWPRPNVDSRAVLFTKKENFPQCRNPVLFMELIRTVFAKRRKNLKNNLSSILDSESILKVLEMCGIPPKARAETLSVSALLSLSDAVDFIKSKREN